MNPIDRVVIMAIVSVIFAVIYWSAYFYRSKHGKPKEKELKEIFI